MTRTNDRYGFVPFSGGGCAPLVAGALRPGGLPRMARWAGVVLPTALIAGLLYAGLFIKPAPAGSALPMPPIERRDAFFGLEMPAPGVIWAVGSGGKIIRSEDGGQRWTRQAAVTDEHLQDIAAWDDRHAVAVGNQGVILRTEDGGAYWTLVPAPTSSVANKLIRVRALADGRAVAVGEMGALLGSRDQGRTWQRLAPERDVGFNALAAVGEHIWVVGEGGTIQFSPDGGTTWRTQRAPTKRSLTGVAFVDDRRGVAVGLDGTVLSTDNGGLDWNDRSIEGVGHLYDVVVDGSGWRAVGERDVLLTAGPDAVTWTARRATGATLAWHSRIAGRDGQWLYAGPGPSLTEQLRGQASGAVAGERS